MDWLRGQVDGRPTSLVVLAAYTAIVGALTIITDFSAALDGSVPAICRVVLGVVGLAGGLLLWTERPTPFAGWAVCMVWAVAQIPVFAWNTDGNPTSQFLEIPLGVTSQTTRNGVVTSYSELGINLAGVILAILLARHRVTVEQRTRAVRFAASVAAERLPS
jgi:hypothetical protein